MDVYVESNFVLELALFQEQYESCQELLDLAETNKIHLIVPAFSLAEPYETLIRNNKKRQKLSEDLKTELSQLRRSVPYQEQIRTFEDTTAFLVSSQQEQKQRLDAVIEKILKVCQIIPLTAEILTAAIKYQSEYNLEPQDSIVYASVLEHIRKSDEKLRCFLNRNSKDFDDPDIKESLSSYNCLMLFSFDNGIGYIKSKLK
ncbi:MAG: PIN domain-containing protein [Cyanobacteriota bacterium]|nr:PIN domain-containing protein [Cyanobacteriota bacterium]